MAAVVDNIVTPILLIVATLSVITLLVVEFSRYRKNQESKSNGLDTEKNIPLSFTINLNEERLSLLASFLKGEIYQQFLQRSFESLEQKRRERIGAEYLNIFRLRDIYPEYPSLVRQIGSIQMTDLDFLQGVGLNANLRGAIMRKVNLVGASLKAADLSLADLSESNLTEVNLISANLVGANLQNTILSKAKLQRCRLSEADLSKADLSYANLQGADLTKANLKDAKLMGADLNDANLSRADLSYSDLRGADLSTALLTGTILQEVIYDEETKWPADYAYRKDL